MKFCMEIDHEHACKFCKNHFLFIYIFATTNIVMMLNFEVICDNSAYLECGYHAHKLISKLHNYSQNLKVCFSRVLYYYICA
jgi:hypothetical protein